MKKIAIIIGGLAYDSQRRIINSIYRRMGELGYDTHIFTCHVVHNSGPLALQGAHQVYRLPNISDYDGVILVPNTVGDKKIIEKLIDEIKEKKIPAVCIDYKVDGVAYILGENYQGMYELVEHLVTVHKKKIFYYLSGPVNNRSSLQRKQAFLDVMEKHNIMLEDFQIFDGSFAPESARRAWNYWESKVGILPEAIVCANDAMAQGILIELGIRKISVPETVIVTGVDNSNFAWGSEPKITTVERYNSEMGEIASNLLVRAMQGEDITREHIKMASRLVVAESCGCVMKDHERYRDERYKFMQESFYSREITATIKSMISDFSGADSLESVLEIIKRYVVFTDAKYFYVCMNDLSKIFEKASMERLNGELEETKLTGGYNEYMTVPLAYEEGKFTSYGAYKSKNILPDEVRRKKTMNYIVIPLYYLDENFGYCVFGNSNFPLEWEQCYTWVLTICGAIQNVRKNFQLQENIKMLNTVWIYDALTRVYNRAGFFQRSKQLVKEAQNERRGLYLLFMDLDGLKKVNDTQGHEAGDCYICAVADILKKVADENELIMRYGGDEFVVMGKVREYNRAEEIMREIEAELAVENRSEKYSFQMAVSMGHETFDPQSEESLEDVLECADQKMYLHKKGKREKQQ